MRPGVLFRLFPKLSLAVLCLCLVCGITPPLHAQDLADASLAGLDIAHLGKALAQRYAGRKPLLWAEHMPGVIDRLFPMDTSDAPEIGPIIALTFDGCGGKLGDRFDADIIATLRAHSIPATLFVTNRWLKANKSVVLELSRDPLFEIGAHGARHKPCSVNGQSVYGIKGTASFIELAEEVEGNARAIERLTGKRPRWFRSGAAYYDDVAVSAIRDMGFAIAGFSITADMGATLPANAVRERLLSAGHGDIVLLHMNNPLSGTREGLIRALPELARRGAVFVRLSDLLAH